MSSDARFENACSWSPKNRRRIGREQARRTAFTRQKDQIAWAGSRLTEEDLQMRGLKPGASPVHIGTVAIASIRKSSIRLKAVKKTAAARGKKPLKLELTQEDIVLDNAISAAAARSLARRRT